MVAGPVFSSAARGRSRGHLRGRARPAGILRARQPPLSSSPADRLAADRRPLKPRAYQATKLAGGEHGQPRVFPGEHGRQARDREAPAPMAIFARNGDGDEVRFIHEGEGRLDGLRRSRLPQGRLSGNPARHDLPFRCQQPNTHLVIESRDRDRSCPIAGCSAVTRSSIRW